MLYAMLYAMLHCTCMCVCLQGFCCCIVILFFLVAFFSLLSELVVFCFCSSQPILSRAQVLAPYVHTMVAVVVLVVVADRYVQFFPSLFLVFKQYIYNIRIFLLRSTVVDGCTCSPYPRYVRCWGPVSSLFLLVMGLFFTTLYSKWLSVWFRFFSFCLIYVSWPFFFIIIILNAEALVERWTDVDLCVQIFGLFLDLFIVLTIFPRIRWKNE